MPGSPEQTRATARPSAARSSAKRQRSTSAPSGNSWRSLPGRPARSGRDRGRSRPVPAPSASRRCASAVRQSGPPGPRPTTASVPCGRPMASGSRSPGASASAQVTRSPLRLGTSNRPAAPAAASAAPSATPQQPVSRNTISEGFARRGVSSRSRSAGEEPRRHAEVGRQGMDRGLGGLQVERGHARRSLARARPCSARLASTTARRLPAGTPASAPTPERQHGRMVDQPVRGARQLAAGRDQRQLGIVGEGQGRMC